MQVPTIITARRQSPSLNRILSLSQKRDHSLSENINKGTYTRCQDKRCLTCPSVITSKTYTTKNGTKLFRNANMTCKTRVLLYLLICKKCRDEYTGETGDLIHRRNNLHRNQITNDDYRKLKVSHHIHECGNDEYELFPFFKCYKDCHIFREEMELHFRAKINPALH